MSRPLKSLVLAVAVLVVTAPACSDASAATPECCDQAADLIAQMDDCCAENFGRPAPERTGCCVEGMAIDATERPECCVEALALRAQMSECCREGMSSADDVCCEG